MGGDQQLGRADGCGRRVSREWLEMGEEKKLLGMSELGCADGCGRRGCKGVAGNGWGEEAAGMSELGCADGCGRRGCEGVAGSGWGEEAAGDERAWLCGRLRTANGVGRRSRWRSASLPAKPLEMSELGCADGCGRRGCKGVAGNGWGEEAAGDERAWLRGRLWTPWVKGVAGNV